MENKTSNVAKNLLQSIEAVGVLAAHYKGDPDKLCQFNSDIHDVAEFLGIKPLQAVIFSVIFILNFKNRSVDITDLADYMETSNLKVLPLLTEIEGLERKRLICRYNGSSRMSSLRRMGIYEIGYFITRNILEGILKNDKSYLSRKENYSMVSLLEEVATLVEDRDDGNVTTDEVVTETNLMLQNNSELDFVRKILSYRLQMENLLLLLYVCRETINGSEGSDLVRTCEKIYEDVDTRFTMRQTLVIGHNELINHDLIKLREGYFKTDREILLTDKALNELFGKDKELFVKNDRSKKELIQSKNLKETRLFFNKEEQEQLTFVTRLLQQTNFQKTILRLEKNNMHSGVAILFHGDPGTGKTASVYDIAMKTGRDIFMVDISNTKSMWFGESEKIIKELFDRYRRIVENSKKAPILLFNECDAVFSSRKNATRSAVDQTENAIQNIILQEIENLKGIMIATTNLTQNLDRAFERRFLFKIAFQKPGPEVLQKIWMDKIHVMKAGEARKLSEKFELSGGNIENVARKVQMHQIINGEYPGFEKLLAFCNEEQLVRNGLRNIGFKIAKEN
ncbi:MAG TPA: ATP-binding protein [Bacteroidales bacterium]|nr:ATP-binding protein [Bacteroidales bacterium]